MRKLLLGGVALAVLMAAGSAGAADLPAAPAYKAPVVAPMATYSWTGFYVGGHAGYTWMNSTDTLSPANAAANGFFNPPPIIVPSLTLDPKGFIGGGQIGYNWQINPMWVIGVETDLSWTNLDSTVSSPAPGDNSRIVTAREQLDWFGTFRARAGFTPADRVLVYATGGLAYGQVRLSTALTRVSLVDGSNTCVLPGGGGNNCQNGSASDTRIGWTVGGGLEWAVFGNWSFKGEYLYYDLGNITHTMTDPRFPAIFNATAEVRGSIARAGLNYRF